MAARRTKKSRVKSKQRRLQSSGEDLSLVRSGVSSKVKAEDLLHYDTSLIVGDLRKTLISTLVVFGALVALYYQL
jgi:hypothetical protein